MISTPNIKIIITKNEETLYSNQKKKKLRANVVKSFQLGT